MNGARSTAPIFIGEIDLGDKALLRIELDSSYGVDRIAYTVLGRPDADGKLSRLDGFALDVSHLAQLMFLTINAHSRARAEGKLTLGGN
jgi:hypothetical protein